MKDEEEEKLRGVYRTSKCMSCGKSMNVDSDIIAFVCDDCMRESNNKTLFSNHFNYSDGLEEMFEEYVEGILEDMYSQIKKEKTTSMLRFIIRYTCPKCKKGKCETITTQDGDYTFIVCKNFAEDIFKMIRGNENV